MIQLFLDDENNNDSIGDAKGKNIFLSPTMTSCMTTCAGSTSISHSIIFYIILEGLFINKQNITVLSILPVFCRY
jgi:hypothetical protein